MENVNKLNKVLVLLEKLLKDNGVFEESSLELCDEVFVNYLISILEEKRISPTDFDLDDFIETISAYIPGIDDIEKHIVAEWIDEIVFKISQEENVNPNEKTGVQEEQVAFTATEEDEVPQIREKEKIKCNKPLSEKPRQRNTNSFSELADSLESKSHDKSEKFIPYLFDGGVKSKKRSTNSFSEISDVLKSTEAYRKPEYVNSKCSTYNKRAIRKHSSNSFSGLADSNECTDDNLKPSNVNKKDTGTENCIADASEATCTISDRQRQQIKLEKTFIEIFPNLSKLEAKKWLLSVNYDLDSAINLVLERKERKLKNKKTKSVKNGVYKNDDMDNDKTWKSYAVQKYGLINEQDDVIVHKPVAPKSAPQKKIMYRDNQVVSTKGEKITLIKK